MKARLLTWFSLLLISFVSLVVPHSLAQNLGSRSDLTPAWNTFANETSVYDTLDNLGPLVFCGYTPRGALVVLWQNDEFTIFVNGRMLGIQNAEYGNNVIRLDGSILGSKVTLRAEFTVGENGELLIETSNGEGFDGLRLGLDSKSGGVIFTQTCQCSGGDAQTTKRKCRNPECADPATQCSTNPGAAQAYCLWYNPGSVGDLPIFSVNLR